MAIFAIWIAESTLPERTFMASSFDFGLPRNWGLTIIGTELCGMENQEVFHRVAPDVSIAGMGVRPGQRRGQDLGVVLC
jgi:hypothetical protein